MERGVYVAQFGGLTELATIDHEGHLVRRVTVRSELYTDRELADLVP